MRAQSRKKILALLKCLPLLVIMVLAAAVLKSGNGMTVEGLLSYTPNNKVLAIFALWGMFALKSLTIFFPLLLLYMAGGFLFPLPIALCINTIGTAISVTLPYLLGRCYGSSMIDGLLKKSPKLVVIQEYRQSHDLFVAFYIRILGILPCDVVSAYMGAIRIAYPVYLLGCILGLLPAICSSSVMGTVLNDLTSPAFLMPLSIQVALAICFSLFFFLHERSKRKKENYHEDKNNL